MTKDAPIFVFSLFLVITQAGIASAMISDPKCVGAMNAIGQTMTDQPHKKYIHAAGDLTIERQRLKDQAEMLRADIWRNVDLSHHALATQFPFLEVGAGVAGQTPHLLAALPAQAKVIGIDVDANQIAHAVENIRREHPDLVNRTSFEMMDAKQMQFANASMSGAYVSWVLEHMPRSEAIAVLKELRRVVKKGGVIIINEVHLDVGTSWIIKQPNQIDAVSPFSKRFLEAMIKEQQDSLGDPNVGSPESMRDLLSQVGFHHFKYQRLVMHYDQNDPRTLDAYAHYLIALWNSVLPDLIKSGKFTQADYEHVKQEVLQSHTLRQEAGQVIITVD
ncbi:MAG: AdoMet dependent proline di-methyltransferase [Bacteriovoracaceae bacterium]|nr:AdoMet dependent proline di-methyltransferase [Bacteriovoracaceae bacterium]